MSAKLPALCRSRCATLIPKMTTHPCNNPMMKKNRYSRIQVMINLTSLIKPKPKISDTSNGKISSILDISNAIKKLMIKCKSMPNQKLLINDNQRDTMSFLPYFIELFDILTEKNIFEQLSHQIVVDLYEFTKEMIFRKKPEIDDVLIYNDSQAGLALSFSREVETIYRMFSFLMFKNSKEFINQDIVKRLVRLLDTPDDEDQNEIQKLLNEVESVLPVYNDLIYNSCIELLIQFNKGQIHHFCIKAAIETITDLIENRSYKVQWSSFVLNELLSLFKSDFLASYYQNLKDLLLVVYKMSETFIHDTFSYAKKHWPLTNSIKQTCFIHQFAQIIKKLNSNATLKELKYFEKIILESIQSDKFQIAATTMQIISDFQMYTALDNIMPNFYSKIMEILCGLSSKWYGNTYKFHIECYDQIKSYKKLKTTFKDVPPNSISNVDQIDPTDTWNLIKELASEEKM